MKMSSEKSFWLKQSNNKLWSTCWKLLKRKFFGGTIILLKWKALHLERNKMVFISKGVHGSSQVSLDSTYYISHWVVKDETHHWLSRKSSSNLQVSTGGGQIQSKPAKKGDGEQKHPRLQDLRCIWLEICEISDQISEIVSANLGKFFTSIASSLGRSVSTDSQVGKLTLDPFEADFGLLNLSPPSKPAKSQKVSLGWAGESVWVGIWTVIFISKDDLIIQTSSPLLRAFLFLPLVWQLLLPMHWPLYMMQFIFKASCY